MKNSVDNDDIVRDRAGRLFEFLQKVTESRTNTIRTIDQYDSVIWLSDIPRERGCACIAWDQDNDHTDLDVWVQITQPRRTPPPEVPSDIAPWLAPNDVADSSIEAPQLHQQIIDADQGDNGDIQTSSAERIRYLDDNPEIVTLWHHWVMNEWSPWADQDQRLQAVQRIYTDLFSIYQRQQRLGETYEVVLGLGYLTWRTSANHDIRRHIITAQTSMTFDSVRGVISLGPGGEGANLRLEDDMLEPQERPDSNEQRNIDSRIAELRDNPWDDGRLGKVLESWIHAVSPLGLYDESLDRQTVTTTEPRVHFAPAIVVRRRTDRSLVRVFGEIRKQIEEGHPIPVGVERIVTIVDDHVPADSRTTEEKDERGDSTSPPSEIYFPLPANDEQREIAERLSRRQGVLVQGPPGTGKSQTIANLVCHLLATGNRVLVTSHTARALNVLKDKFPPQISNLCVTLLGDNREALQSLEDSVREITDRYQIWSPQQNQQFIDEREKSLDTARRAEASTLAELRAIREAETFRYPPRFGDYEGTAQVIAARVRREGRHYKWLTETPAEDDEPPLSDSESMELLALLREIDDSLAENLKKAHLNPDDLKTPVEFEELIDREREAQRRFDGVEVSRSHPAYASLSVISPNKRELLVLALSNFVAEYESLHQHYQPWVKEAAVQIVSDEDKAWAYLAEETRRDLTAIDERIERVSVIQVSGIGDRVLSTVNADAEDLLQHLENGGGFGFGPFRPKVVKKSLYLIREVKVDGRECDSVESLHLLTDWIGVSERISSLMTHWEPYINMPRGSVTVRAAAFRDQLAILERILKLVSQKNSLKGQISAVPGLTEPNWHDAQDVEKLIEAAGSVTYELNLEEARTSVDLLEEPVRAVMLDPNVHPTVTMLRDAIRARDSEKYTEGYETILSLHKAREQLERRDALFKRLENTAPSLASQLRTTFDDDSWDTRLQDFTGAWNWARAEGWISRLIDSQELDRLTSQLDHFRSYIRELIGELAAAKAWGFCFSRMTEEERQHLISWAMAVRRIGRGTSRRASIHRQAARDHMEKCRSAIPAWIMPIYRVAETFRPGEETFHVAIVDEASQSGPEALFLSYLAEKIVVVGDDQQISPENVGVNREAIDLLRQRSIPDIPANDSLGADNSLFDQAAIRYAGRIRLREHFRCMPEIIQFSNNLCYRSEPLIPLRQYGTGRITPTIKTVHVKDGYATGARSSIYNPPESQAVVDQILECCLDPAYDGKSIGVISLLGDQQARRIEQLLLDQIGPEEMEKRQLICGNAYTFQGDERDIIFLSMVSAPTQGYRIGPLTNQRDVRRFNVAASRARDQMWLFHTATLNDLNPRCVRYQLLEYCQNPILTPTTIDGLDIEELRATARTTNRQLNPPRPFGSWFEVDVFLKIVDRGYRVIPQYEIAGYYIDLLVEGMQGRLAVECDGDRWHGADRYEADMARQRQLERSGMKFWRVRGSEFYRDPDGALEGLWDVLERMQIRPGRTESREPDLETIDGEEGVISEQLRGMSTPSAATADAELTLAPESIEVETTSKNGSHTFPEAHRQDGSTHEQPNQMLPVPGVSPTTEPTAAIPESKSSDELQSENVQLIEDITCKPATVWFSLSSWAKENDTLLPWERSLAFNIGRLMTQGRKPSYKQSQHAKRIYNEAIRLGFDEVRAASTRTQPDMEPESQNEIHSPDKNESGDLETGSKRRRRSRNRITCPECGKTFRTSNGRQWHLRNIHKA